MEAGSRSASRTQRDASASAGARADLARVARAMLGEYDELLDAIAEQVWRTVPAYSQYVLEQSDLRDRIGDSVRNIITCLLEGREPSPAELARSARNGERRALQGVAPMALIQSYRTAERILGEEFQGWCARMQVRPASARAGRAALISHLDRLERATLDAYSEIQAQVEADDRLSELTLFRRLAAGERIEPADIERLAIAVGIADPDRTGFLAVAVGPRVGEPRTTESIDRTSIEQHRLRLAAALSDVAGTTVLSGTVDRPGGPIVLLALPWSDAPEAIVRDIDRVLDRVGAGALRAAVGDASQGLAALRTSSDQAMAALEATAAAGVAGRGGAAETMIYADALLEVLVHRDPLIARQLADRYLDPLAGHPELLTTLRTHVDQHLSPSATAEALGVHKNTVLYRLHRIAELTGLDLRRPRDVARLVVALDGARVQE
ncbi:PucR family transcriptional regulator [Agromyces silvae]|uniref:PucR family transcriptional regulator n=1 Tax=Agromyces silvae TaxID=3388266 RepID=UPI00280B5E5A|nr:helix-turn-helix domain-containing protein [Agromyces protaetiae]